MACKMKKITIVSGTRADWGLLSPVCKSLRDDPDFDLRLVVTGQHLMQNANSIQRIEDEGFSIGAQIDMELSDTDHALEITQAMGRAVIGMAAELSDHRPDLVMILGDRYEILAVTQAALIAKVPVAHICGGDITEGAMDDAIRHAMTKLSHIHFVTNEDAQKRVIQMGEDPDHVYCVGNPGLDHIHSIKFMTREEFYTSIAFKPRAQNIIVTFHPVTLEEDSLEQCNEMLKALKALGDDVGIICTGSNADPQGQKITQLVKQFAQEQSNACFHESLGSVRYLNALHHLDAVVGNSSSGLYEAPSFDIPTVNIGNRQQGRLKAASVIDCEATQSAISAAIGHAFEMSCKDIKNPYGDGHAAEKILQVLKNTDDFQSLCRKQFKDLGK